MQTKTSSAITKFWNDFVNENSDYKDHDLPNAWYFCDNQKDANECAELVIKGIKQATATSLWWYETNKHPLPQIGDINIVTNWKGEPKAIIQTTKIERVAYKDIDAEFAATEGEGDGSLEFWRTVHWAYYSREMKPYGDSPSEDMIIVCEHFKTLWPS